MPDRPTLAFADDRSLGAQQARSWIRRRDWTGWASCTLIVRDGPGGSASEVPDPLSACGFAETTTGELVGDPRTVLAARHEDAILVVGAVGHARHQLAHIGKVPEHLLHAAREPVVIAREPVPGGPVLVCVDGSAHAGAAVETLLLLPWLRTARVVVLAADRGDRSLVPVARRTGERLEKAGACVEVVVTVPDELDLTVNPRWTVLDTIDRVGPDLVTLGTRGMSGLERLWVGSVASAVVRHSTCSVLVARDGQRHEHVADC
jgi:nucleotide-binding universal stress UspA family protein